MKAAEAAALLLIAAAYDNRKPDADQAKAWAMALDGLRFEDCREVIVGYYQRSREWLMPVDVINGVKKLRYKRVADHGPVSPPSWLDADDVRAYIRWERETHDAIANGTYQPEAPAAIEGRDVIAELGQVGTSVRDALRTEHSKGVQKKRAAEAERIAERDAKQARMEEMRTADREARRTDELAPMRPADTTTTPEPGAGRERMESAHE